jgi:IS5 family transposase
MTKNVRFKKQTTDSFFGSFLYEQVIPKDHFLVKAKEIIDWEVFSRKLLKWYRISESRGGGNLPYDPALLLRMLFLSYLYNISERQIEERVTFDLTFKYFVGLGVDEKAPDHSTLTYFKERLLLGGGKSAFDELLREILKQAQSKGIQFGSIQIIDATHTTADVNTDKDKQRKRGGKKDNDGKPKLPAPPRDPDAAWGVKHVKEVKNIETGKIEKQKECFYGYKSHTSMNAASNLIISITTTPGNEYDGKQFIKVANKDNQTKGLDRHRVYATDKASDDGEIHEFLKEKQFGNAVRLKKTRTALMWQKLQADPKHREGLAERYKVERKFAEEKQGHGLKRCRYLGLTKYHAQTVMTALAVNLKVVVAFMTGSTLKGYAHSGDCVRSDST